MKKSKKNRGVRSSRPHAGADRSPNSMGIAYGISALGHAILFTALVFSPEFSPRMDPISAAITVNMVSLPSPGPPAAASRATPAPPAQTEATAPKETREPVKIPEPSPPKVPEKPADVSLAPKKTKIKPKRSLKKKTYKPRKVVKRAIRRLEKQVETANQEPLKDVFSELRKSVEKQASLKQTQKKPVQGAGIPSGVPGGGGGAGGGRVAGALDIYRLNTALQIEQNWAFSHQLAGKKKELKASLVFKVFPSGEIRDVFFTERSGNRYLDESAYKAIVKSNPVKPHPSGVAVPYVEMGLRFTPEGIR